MSVSQCMPRVFAIRQAEALFAVNDEERIARDRVERFDATADQHRNLSKSRQIEIVERAFGGRQLGATQTSARRTQIAGRKRFMPAPFSSPRKSDEMITELNEQTEGDNHAGDVRRDEAWVMHDLQNRRLVAFFKPA